MNITRSDRNKQKKNSTDMIESDINSSGEHENSINQIHIKSGNLTKESKDIQNIFLDQPIKEYSHQSSNDPNQKQNVVRSSKSHSNSFSQNQSKFRQKQSFQENLLSRLSRNVQLEDLPDRSINSNESQKSLKSNKICTSKYTVWSFIPLNLIEQFSRFSNIYFLIFGLLEMIRPISTSDGLPVIYLPLGGVVIVTAFKDLYEDYQRHKADKAENQQPIQKGLQELTNIQIQFTSDHTYIKRLIILSRIESEYLCRYSFFNNNSLIIGDIILVKQGEPIPADLVILRTSDPKGKIYIETKNLDGETNLKTKSLAKPFLEIYDNSFNCLSRKGVLYCEGPNTNLYEFQGRFEYMGQSISLNQDNLVLRGSVLRNTKYMIGLTTYTGHETKVMLNSQIPSIKRSQVLFIKRILSLFQVEITMNKLILQIVIVQVLICLFASLFNVLWFDEKKSQMPYLDYPNDYKDNFFTFFIMAGAWIIIFMNFIPISLMITLDFARIAQGFLIHSDKYMKSQKGIEARVQTSKIIEDLGQIRCIFSDKTGTLTQNVMNFRKLFLRNNQYGIMNIPKSHLEQMPKNVCFYDFELNELLAYKDKSNKQYLNANEALTCLSVCHSIIIDEETGEFQSSSQDEIAFINFAQHCGYEYQGIDINNIMTIQIDHEITLKFKVLNVLEFSSARKRMSVIVRNLETQQIILYSKGADDVIFKLLSQDNEDQNQKAQLDQYLQESSVNGLRTLVLAYKIIDENEYIKWNQKMEMAQNDLSEREKNCSYQMDKMEKGLFLIGATAIEDTLQTNVYETIQNLKKANINFWILTGDKMETAINIGYSSGVLSQDDEIVMAKDKFLELDEKILEISKQQYSMIIDGEFLEQIVIDNDQLQKLLRIAKHFKSVIACRVSPKQKKDIVNIYKQAEPLQRTLAIGDGANDVNMITEAHVGIGIKGLEGNQAARASDFSIGEFMHLQRLLLCHGRESYRKNCVVINYNFYKNVVYLFPMFWFGIFSGFSASTIWDLGFNAFYTALPIILFAILDKEFSYSFLARNPLFYIAGQESKYFNTLLFWMWFFQGIIHSLFLTMCILFATEEFEVDGLEISIVQFGQMVFFVTILVVNFKVMVIHHVQIVICVVVNILSSLLYPLSLIIIGSIKTNVLYDMFNRIFVDAYYYGSILICICMCNFFDLAMIKWEEQNYFASITQKICQNKTGFGQFQNGTKMFFESHYDLETDSFREDSLQLNSARTSNASELTQNLLKNTKKLKY